MSRKAIDFTENNHCSNCGSCCTDFLPLTINEKQRIRKYIKEHNIKEQRHNFVQGVDATCPFRDDTNKKCLIYEVRPSICRTFICNMKQEKLEENKEKHLKRGQVTFMRKEFFESKEYDSIQKILISNAVGGI